jgi:hypothetical protein
MAGGVPVMQLSTSAKTKIETYDIDGNGTTAIAICPVNTTLYVSWAVIQAKITNVDPVFIGPSYVTNVGDSGVGLAAGEILKVYNQFMNEIYLNSVTNSEGVVVTYWVANQE